jgi:hypothetical protein
MPGTRDKVYAALGHTPPARWRDALQWGDSLTGAQLQPGLVLFPRPPAEKTAGVKP